MLMPFTMRDLVALLSSVIRSRFYATMKTEESKISNQEVKSPLLIEGRAPLDVLIEMLGESQKQFCRDLDDLDTSTYRKWRQGVPPSLTPRRWKILTEKMARIGLTPADLPDNFGVYQSSKSA